MDGCGAQQLDMPHCGCTGVVFDMVLRGVMSACPGRSAAGADKWVFPVVILDEVRFRRDACD